MNVMTSVLLAILVSFFMVSSAYAHPNHMTFEQIKHELETLISTSLKTDKMMPYTLQEDYEHNDNIVPCTQEHKATPCKKK